MAVGTRYACIACQPSVGSGLPSTAPAINTHCIIVVKPFIQIQLSVTTAVDLSCLSVSVCLSLWCIVTEWLICFLAVSLVVMSPTSVGRGHYKMMTGVCPSVCLSVACFDLTRERKALGNPKLAGWKPITRITREPI